MKEASGSKLKDGAGHAALSVSREGLVDVSETSENYETSGTYTAIYERDGENWAARIAEEPRVHSRGHSMAEVRENIRIALAAQLNADSQKLHIVDNFRLPTEIRDAQDAVKATRTEDERTQMMASMTDSRTAMSWAKDLGISMRDPVTVQALESLGDREVSIDTFCHTITMAEELSRFAATGDGSYPGTSLGETCPSET